MLKDYVGKYFGPDKIKSIRKSKDKTYLGNDKVVIHLENGIKKEIPLAMLEATKGEKMDYTSLRDKICEKATLDILTILIEAELSLEDIQYVIQKKVPFSVNMSVEKASKKLWKKELYERTLMDVERVLTHEQKN